MQRICLRNAAEPISNVFVAALTGYLAFLVASRKRALLLTSKVSALVECEVHLINTSC